MQGSGGEEEERGGGKEGRGRLKTGTCALGTDIQMDCKVVNFVPVKLTTQAISLLARSSTSRGTTPASTTAWIRSVLPSVR